MKSLVGNGKMIGNWKSWLSRWPKYKQRGHYRPGFNYDMGRSLRVLLTTRPRRRGDRI